MPGPAGAAAEGGGDIVSVTRRSAGDRLTYLVAAPRARANSRRPFTEL